jgi:hypothetical protein
MAIALIFGLINAPCQAVCASIGEVLSQALTRSLWRSVFNTSVALMLAISTHPIAASEKHTALTEPSISYQLSRLFEIRTKDASAKPRR